LRGAAGTASDTDRGATLVGGGALGTASDTDKGYNLVGGSALGSDIAAASGIDTASLGVAWTVARLRVSNRWNLVAIAGMRKYRDGFLKLPRDRS
jgi:hypothetical protein